MNIVGVDEVGRGCLYGDVVAAAVILPPTSAFPDDIWKGITDSKKLTAKKRASLTLYIQKHAIAWSIGRASPKEIDELNILQATMLAMHRALDGIQVPVDKILVDGTYFKPYKNVPSECVVGGDAKVMAIGAASILAKHTRDTEILTELKQNPDLQKYGLATNMGYGTKVHCEALQRYGPTCNHRMTFGKVVKNET